MAAKPSEQARPTVVLAMGDPAGISPELTAKLLAIGEVLDAASLIVIGDRRVLEDGAKIAKVALDVDTVSPHAPLPESPGRPILVDLGHLNPAAIKRAEISSAGGMFAKENFLSALALAKCGAAHAVAFTPFNKSAMRLAQPNYDDEISFTANAIRFRGEAREFNVLEGLWNARVTSHVPLAAVSGCYRPSDREGARTDACRDGSGRLLPAAHRGSGAQSACRRQRQLRPRGDRHHRSGGAGGKGERHRLQRALSLRHRVRASAQPDISTPC